MGATGFTVVNAQIVNTGGIPFTSVVISIAGSSNKLQIAYSSPLTAGGWTATVSAWGLSGCQYTALSPNTSVSGNLAASAGASYAVVIECTLSNGATFSQAISVVASP